jgi:hypothetical protein
MAEDTRPEFPRQHAAEQKVLNGLRLLIAEGAGRWMVQPASVQTVQGPTPVATKQPRNKLAVVGCSRSLNMIGDLRSDRAREEGFVRRSCGKTAIRLPGPSVHISYLWV